MEKFTCSCGREVIRRAPDQSQCLDCAAEGDLDSFIMDAEGYDSVEEMESSAKSESIPISQPPSRDMLVRYELGRELGAGGMGVVYEAFDKELERKVALKVFLPGRCGERDVRRFIQESKAIARLDHPNIVKLFEVGQQPLHFTMECVSGQPLNALIKDNLVNPQEAAKIAEKVALALQASHDSGIIHRDIKPSNILIDENKQPKVLDFGVAKLENNENISRTGDMVGTLLYMSPEQAQSKKVDRRTDIYSLGATLYQALTKRPPFQGDSNLSLSLQIISREPVRPRLLNSSIPEDLEAICLKCLEKTPQRRYANAHSLARDLKNYLENRPVSAKMPTKFTYAKKFAMRNKALCGVALAFFLLFTAFASTGFVLYFKVRAEKLEKQKTQARLAQERSRRISIEEERKSAEKRWRATDEERMYAQRDVLDLSDRLQKSIRDRKLLEKAQLTASAVENVKSAKEVKYDPTPDPLEYLAPREYERQEDATENEQMRLIQSEKDYYPHKRADIQNSVPQSPEMTEKVRSDTSKNSMFIAVINTTAKNMPVPKISPEPLAQNQADSDSSRSPDDAFAEADIDYRDFRPGVLDVGFSGDGRLFITGNDDGSASIGEVETGAIIYDLKHGSEVISASISTDGRMAATGGKDGKVKLWKLGSQDSLPLFTLNAHFAPISYTQFSGDGALFYCTSENIPLQAWNVKDGTLVFSYSGKEIDGKIPAFDSIINPIEAKIYIEKNDKSARKIEFAPNSGLIVSIGRNNEVKLWRNMSPAPALKNTLQETRNVTSAITSPNGKTLALGYQDGSIKFWDIENRKTIVFQQYAHKDTVSAVKFSPEAGVFISGSLDGEIKIWRITTEPRSR